MSIPLNEDGSQAQAQARTYQKSYIKAPKVKRSTEERVEALLETESCEGSPIHFLGTVVDKVLNTNVGNRFGFITKLAPRKPSDTAKYFVFLNCLPGDSKLYLPTTVLYSLADARELLGKVINHPEKLTKAKGDYIQPAKGRSGGGKKNK